jgi:serine protease AprX
VENPGFVSVEVFDLRGRKVSSLISEQKDPGTYAVPFNGQHLPAGTYLYRISSGGTTVNQKLVLTK